MRENYKPLKGTNLTIVANDIPIYHLPGNVYYFIRFDVRCSMQPSVLSVVNSVLNLHNLLLYMDQKLEYI